MGKVLSYLNPKSKSHIARTAFTILVYFLFSFVIIRLFIYGMVYGPLPEMYVYIKGVHIHHLNFGIFILAITGFLSLIAQTERFNSKIAKIYGIGLALTFDEFGMFLFLNDNYWVRQSYDGIIIIVAILLNIIYFGNIWKKVIGKGLNLSTRGVRGGIRLFQKIDEPSTYE